MFGIFCFVYNFSCLSHHSTVLHLMQLEMQCANILTNPQLVLIIFEGVFFIFYTFSRIILCYLFQLSYSLIPKICEWAKYQNSHSSKSIWVTKLSFCQNDPLMRESFWQKIGLVTHILFELGLFWYVAHSQILGNTFYVFLRNPIFPT